MPINQLPPTPNVGPEVPNSLWKWLIEMGNRIRALIDWANSYVAPSGVEAHASTHASGGSDELTPAAIGAATAVHSHSYPPPGAVMAFAMSTPPDGWLKCNGQAVSRTTYATLFSAIGTTFGIGDGSTTFNVPDLRGEFVRGWDDERGVDSVRTFGSAQGDAMRVLTGKAEGNYLSSSPTSVSGVLSGSGIQQTTNRYAYTSGIYWGAKIEFDNRTETPTADENRPRNIALLYCIKY